MIGEYVVLVGFTAEVNLTNIKQRPFPMISVYGPVVPSMLAGWCCGGEISSRITAAD